MCDICDGKSYDQARREMLGKIARNDYTKVSVEGGEVLPSFTYSLGLWAFHKAPEIIVIGLHHHAPAIVDDYARQVIRGERFRSGRIYRRFFPGSSTLVQEVDRSLYEEWLCWAPFAYPDGDFPVLQLIWQDDDGAWPWEPDWQHCEPQPVLTDSGRPDVDPRTRRRAA